MVVTVYWMYCQYRQYQYLRVSQYTQNLRVRHQPGERLTLLRSAVYWCSPVYWRTTTGCQVLYSRYTETLPVSPVSVSQESQSKPQNLIVCQQPGVDDWPRYARPYLVPGILMQPSILTAYALSIKSTEQCASLALPVCVPSWSIKNTANVASISEYTPAPQEYDTSSAGGGESPLYARPYLVLTVYWCSPVYLLRKQSV